MKSESILMEQIENQLVELGYNTLSISSGVKTPGGNEIDLVIFEDKKPRVAVEIKGGRTFPESPDPVDLRFHPAVRTTQRLAKDIGAPYFAIADGERILWFEADESGRPRLLSSPVLPGLKREGFETSVELNKESITRILFRLLDLTRDVSDPYKQALYTLVAIYARMVAETGNSSLEQSLVDPFGRPDAVQFFEQELRLTERLEKGQAFFLDAFNILERVTFKKFSPKDLLAALDEFLLIRIQHYAFKLPRWLTDLFVDLSDINNSDQVLDIFSNFGDIAAAIALSGKRTRVVSIVNHPVNYLFATIQQLILGVKDQNQVLIGEMPPLDIRHSGNISQFSRIIVAPPFNVRLTSINQKVELSEDAYLSLALDWVSPRARIVAIVPEGFLFSKSSRRNELRQYILKHTRVKAIIGLDAFIPNTSIKASILVLDKALTNAIDGVLMGRIQRSEIPSNIHAAASCTEIPRIAKLLDAFHSQDKNLIKAASLSLVPIGDLIADNLTVDRYILPQLTQPPSTYKTAKLGDVAEIFKGSPLTLDKNGDLFVLGPAAVRKLSIDVAKMDRTTTSKLPRRPVTAQSSDIVINALDKYRGQAAIVGSEFAGYYISRNIIVVRLKSTEILATYLAIALNSGYVTLQLLNRTSGSVIPQITKGALLEVEIPLPELEVQKQIVEQAIHARHEILVAQQMLNEYRDKLNQAEVSLNYLLEHLHTGGGE